MLCNVFPAEGCGGKVIVVPKVTPPRGLLELGFKPAAVVEPVAGKLISRVLVLAFFECGRVAKEERGIMVTSGRVGVVVEGLPTVMTVTMPSVWLEALRLSGRLEALKTKRHELLARKRILYFYQPIFALN